MNASYFIICFSVVYSFFYPCIFIRSMKYVTSSWSSLTSQLFKGLRLILLLASSSFSLQPSFSTNFSLNTSRFCSTCHRNRYIPYFSARWPVNSSLLWYFPSPPTISRCSNRFSLSLFYTMSCGCYNSWRDLSPSLPFTGPHTFFPKFSTFF